VLVAEWTGGRLVTTPWPSGPGLAPLDSEPLSVRPPYTTAAGHHEDHQQRYLALLTALGDLELGSYDVRVLCCLAELGTPGAAVVCSLLHRVRAQAHHEANQHP
jgi:hypothetical protein